MDRVLNINWFSEIGKQWITSENINANSLIDAEAYLASPEWESVTLEESNKISGYLSIKDSIIFQEWNGLIKEAKLFFQKDVLRGVPHINNFDNRLLHQCMEWDVVHYLVEEAYKEKLKRPFFFNELINIYESGHMPCGWAGKRPGGKLIIY